MFPLTPRQRKADSGQTDGLDRCMPGGLKYFGEPLAKCYLEAISGICSDPESDPCQDPCESMFF